MEISLTEENYIKAVFSISAGNGGRGASTNQLSAHLNNKAASVTDMLRRLADKKLIHYEKYKNVTLTAKGEKMALAIVRKHRLWEVFLTQTLRFGWDEVHEIAEQLEHIKSDELINRLDRFLGHPRFDPHGDPIPDSKGHVHPLKARPLNSFGTKGHYVFMGVAEHSSSFLQYLSSLNLAIGDTIKIEEINTFDQSLKVKINRQPSCFFGEKVSCNILVEEKR